ncbi:MAG: hypothetical protein H6739_41670 [Alphaproteobacteria bacterium]|nr:hypothetical protein [Alphaproteobacteria bacterium]
MLFLLLACAPPVLDDTQAPPEWVAPDQQGPYGVGAETIRWTDARGKDLVAEIWFPAIVEPDDTPDDYPELPIAAGAYRNVPPDTRGAPYPLVAFSHGNGGIRYQSVYLTEFLASHGFVTVAVDHPDNTLLDLDEDAILTVFLERPGDVIASVDEVYARATSGDELLDGLVDPEAGYAMSGHSFGAWTSLIVGGGDEDLTGIVRYCEGRGGIACRYLSRVEVDDPELEIAQDPRVVTTLPMSPGVWYSFGDQGEGLASVTLPFLQAGDNDDILDFVEEATPVYEAMSAPKHMAVFADAGHYAFSDICQVAGPLFDDCEGPEGGYIDIEVAHEISRAITTAWLGVTLKGDDRYAPWLEEDWAAAHPELRWLAE